MWIKVGGETEKRLTGKDNREIERRDRDIERLCVGVRLREINK